MGGILNLAARNRYNGGDVPTININTDGSGSSTGAVINTVLGIGGLLLTGAVSGRAAQTSGSTTKAPAEQEAAQRNDMIAYLSSPEGIANELQNVDTTIKNLNAEKDNLTEIVSGFLEKSIQSLDNQINVLNTKNYPYGEDSNQSISAEEIQKKISDRNAALAGQKSLKAQFDTDRAAIKSYQTAANSSIGSITVGNETISEPEINENGNITGESYRAQYKAIISNPNLQKTPPTPDDKGKVDTKKAEEFNQYQQMLNKESEVEAKEGQLNNKAEAIRNLNQFKATYGVNLDGSGGTYKEQMDNYQDTIDEVNTFETQHPDAFADQNTLNHLTQQKASKEAILSAYQITVPDAKQSPDDTNGENKPNESNKTEINKTAISARIAQLNHQLEIANSYRRQLVDLQGMSSNVTGLQQQDETLDKQDGNWFSRLFSKNKRKSHKTRKNTQATLAVSQNKLAKATQAMLKKMELEAQKST